MRSTQKFYSSISDLLQAQLTLRLTFSTSEWSNYLQISPKCQMLIKTSANTSTNKKYLCIYSQLFVKTWSTLTVICFGVCELSVRRDTALD
jgi:hypothetical protein